MIIHTYHRSKKRKPNAKQRQLQADWDELIKKHTPKNPVKLPKKANYVPPKSSVRETPKYPSLQTNLPMTCTKPVEGKRYTGDKMIGIGTLHKSNAVPVFSEDEAKDQATMRR